MGQDEKPYEFKMLKSIKTTPVKAQNRTYQDLLKNKNDEYNFEQLTLSELYKVSLNGIKTIWKESNMYRSTSFSPDGNYVMITTIEKPFSYLVPYYRKTVKNKKARNAFNINNLNIPPRHLSPSSGH